MNAVQLLLNRVTYEMIRRSDRPQPYFRPDGRRLRGVVVNAVVFLGRDGKFYLARENGQTEHLDEGRVLLFASVSEIDLAVERIVDKARRYGPRRRRSTYRS